TAQAAQAVPAQSADDAGGDGMSQAERIAYGNDEVAHAQPVGIAQRQLSEIFSVDLNHGKIRVGILADKLGVEFAPIVEAHGYRLGVIHHVVIGDDDALVGINDDAGAGRHALSWHGRLLRQVEEV